MVPDSLPVIGGQFHCFWCVHRGGHLFALSFQFVEQSTILRDRELPPKNSAYMMSEFVLGVNFVDLRKSGQDFLSQEFAIPTCFFHLLSRCKEFAGPRQQWSKRQAIANGLTFGRLYSVSFAIWAVVALHESEFNKAIDVPTEGSFIDSANSTADLVVGSEHRVSVPRFEKAQHRLERLNMSWTETEQAASVSERAEDCPDVGFRCGRGGGALADAKGLNGKLCECHVC